MKYNTRQKSEKPRANKPNKNSVRQQRRDKENQRRGYSPFNDSMQYHESFA